MEPNIIIKKMNYKSMNISDNLLNSYFEFENLLRETLLSKKIVRRLRKGNMISVKEVRIKYKKCPFGRS